MLSRRTVGLLPAFLLIALIPSSCARTPLPEVPAFDELGFADSLDVVRKQVRAAYEDWQDEPRNARLNGRLGMLLSAYAKNGFSEILYRRARSLAPDEFRWAYYHAVALLQTGRHEEAAVAFRRAIEIDPDYVAARVYLADLLLQLNEIEESIALYRAITAEYPTSLEGWLGLGKALDRGGDAEGALHALRRARIIGPQYGEVHYALGTVLAASGAAEAAASEFAAYERTAGNTIGKTDTLTREIVRLNAGDGPFMAQADYQLKRGDVEAAIASFRAALAVNPANQDAWGGLVHAQALAGELDEAGEAYRAALAAGISYARLHLTYGRALLDRHRLDAAREVIGEAVALDPQYADAWAALGDLELQAGAPQRAAESYHRSLAARPNDGRVMLSLAQARNAAGRFDLASDRLESLTGDPELDSATVFRELAIAYRGLGRDRDAIDTLKRAREAASGSADTSVADSIDVLLAEWQDPASR